MNSLNGKYHLNESGISLVEVIASIVILSVILISVFTMLTQSGKTTKNNEDIVEATYLAQMEIEKLYNESLSLSANEYPTALINLNYKYDRTKTDADGYTIETYYYDGTTINNAYVEISVKLRIPDSPLLIIYVYDKKNGKLKAQMQNIFEWSWSNYEESTY